MIKVMIAEDQRMLRGALSSLLELENDLEIIAQASNGEAQADSEPAAGCMFDGY